MSREILLSNSSICKRAILVFVLNTLWIAVIAQPTISLETEGVICDEFRLLVNGSPAYQNYDYDWRFRLRRPYGGPQQDWTNWSSPISGETIPVQIYDLEVQAIDVNGQYSNILILDSEMGSLPGEWNGQAYIPIADPIIKNVCSGDGVSVDYHTQYGWYWLDQWDGDFSISDLSWEVEGDTDSVIFDPNIQLTAQRITTGIHREAQVEIVVNGIENLSRSPKSLTFNFNLLNKGCEGTPLVVHVNVDPILYDNQLIVNGDGQISEITLSWDDIQPINFKLLNNGEGAPMDLEYQKGDGDWTIIGSGELPNSSTVYSHIINQPENDFATYKFRGKSRVSPCSQLYTGNEITVHIVPKPSVTFTPPPAVVCSGYVLDIGMTDSHPETIFLWSRTVNGGNISDASGSGIFNHTLTNTTSVATNDAHVTYTITPQLTSNGITVSGDVQTFSLDVRPHFDSGESIIGYPTTICNGGDVVLQLSDNTGKVIWKRVSEADRNNPTNATKLLHQIELPYYEIIPEIVGYEHVQHNIDESSYFWAELDTDFTGGCGVNRYPSMHVSVLPEPSIIIDPLPNFDGQNGNPSAICWDDTFTQVFSTHNNDSFYEWTAAIDDQLTPNFSELDASLVSFQVSGDINGPHELSQQIINNSGQLVSIKYSITPKLGPCTVAPVEFNVTVQPRGDAGMLSLPVQEACMNDRLPELMFDIEGVSGPYKIQFSLPGQDIWVAWPVGLSSPLVNTEFRVKSLVTELYGCPIDPDDLYSNVVEFKVGDPINLTDQPPPTSFIPFCGKASLLKIDIPLVGPDAEDWYWQTMVDGREHSDNSLAKTYHEGETAFIQEYVDGCWGNSHAVDFETFPVPQITDPQIQSRFGSGSVVLSVSSDHGTSYEWFESGQSNSIEGQSEHQFTTAEIALDGDPITYDVHAVSQYGCTGSKVSLSADVYPYPQLLLGDGGSILEPTADMLLTVGTPYDDPAYITQINSEGVTVSWLLDGIAYDPAAEQYSFLQEGLYQYEVTLPNGKKYTTPGVRRRNWINEPNETGSGENVAGTPPAENLTAPALNYVRTYTTRQKTTDENIFDLATSSADMMVETSYSDGLGRGVQSVSRGSSPGGFDFVQPTSFDELGRSPHQYMAYTTSLENQSTGAFRPDALLEQYEFYNQSGNSTLPQSTYAYSRVRYEDSPLNRVLESAKPGEVYLPGNDWSGIDKKTAKAYTRSNREELDSAIHRYFLDSKTIKYQSNHDYPDHSLAVSVSEDEMGKEYLEFSNKRGQLVQSRVRDSDGHWVKTNYIYDDFGNLRVIMTPEALHKMESPDYDYIEDENAMALNYDKELYSYQHVDYYYVEGVRVTLKEPFRVSSYTDDLGPDDRFFISKSENGREGRLITSINVHEQLFIYEYDERQQLIASKSPGADWQYFVYDRWGRQIMSQGPHMRLADSLWSFTKFDNQSRPVLSGVVDLGALTPEEIRAAARAATAKHEDWTGAGDIGYTINNTYPTITEADLRSVLYYDHYNFPGAAGYPFTTYTANNGKSMTTADKSTGVIGLSTGGKLRLLDANGTWLTSVSYYNDDYELVQSVGDNHLGAKDRSFTWYNYTGTVDTEVTVYNEGITNGAADTPQQVEITRGYTYDHRDRLLSVDHQIDDNEVVTLSGFAYNELGETIRKDLHATTGQPTPIQQLDYTYDIRGALTTVNNPDNPNEGPGGLPDVFGMELSFEHGFDQGHFNGQLSGMSWFNRKALEPQEDVVVNHFGYQYDDMGRMSLADYTGVNDFTVRVDRYDQNGNILKLTRKGEHGDMDSKIDELYYVYDGDRIRKVSDQSQQDEGYADRADDEEELHYDLAGNLVIEENKGIQQITYNDLNKPTRITLDNGDYLSYTYDAAGMKLTSSVYVGGALVDSTIYHGELQYQASATAVRLGHIFHEEGRIVENIIDDPVTNPVQPHGWNKLDYQYYLTDHLGNIRSILSSDMDRIQVFRATMEDDELDTEQAHFDNLDMRTSNSAYDYTRIRTGNNSYTHTVPLDGINDIIGPAFTYRVQAGDQITMEAWAKYAGSHTNAQAGALDAALTDAFWIDNGLGELVNTTNPFGAIASTLTGVVNTHSNVNPKAYLTYIFLDESFEFDPDTGYDMAQVTTAAQGQHEALGLSRIFDENGYLFVYVSNQGVTNTPIYFDELTITVDMSPIDQAQDYYPFGLTFNGHTYSQDAEDGVDPISETSELIHDTFEVGDPLSFDPLSGNVDKNSSNGRLRIRGQNSTSEAGRAKRTISKTAGSELMIQFSVHGFRGLAEVYVDDQLLGQIDQGHSGTHTFTTSSSSSEVDLIIENTAPMTDDGSNTMMIVIDNLVIAETVTHTPGVPETGLSNRSVAAYLGHTRFLSEPNKRFYQGKEAQELIDLYDFHARLYDAGLGRFTGVDPAGQFSSPYAGMGNNPAMGVDPDGEFAFAAGVIWGAVGGAQVAHENGGNIQNGFTYGGLGGILGSVWRPEGLLYGAAKGLAISGIEMIRTGRLSLTSLSMAGISTFMSGFRASLNGGNLLTGIRTHDSVVNYEGLPIGKPKTDEEIKALANEKFGWSEGGWRVKQLTASKIPNNYIKRKDGFFADKKNPKQRVGGVAEYNPNFKTTRIYISPASASNNIQLQATLGHELIHAYHRNNLSFLGLDEKTFEHYTENTAHKWSWYVHFSQGQGNIDARAIGHFDSIMNDYPNSHPAFNYPSQYHMSYPGMRKMINLYYR